MKTLDELKELREKMEGVIDLRREDEKDVRIVVSMATCGIASGARQVLNAFAEGVMKKKLTKNVMVTQSGCIGLCKYEPVAVVTDADGDKTTYIRLTPEKVEEIIEKHIIDGTPIAKYSL